MSESPVPIIDEEALMMMVGGNGDLLREIVRHFLDDYPTYLGRLVTAIAAGDRLKVERTAHTLRGAILNFHAPGAAGRARIIEQLARDGDLAEAPHLVHALQTELGEVARALQALCESKS